MGRLAVLASRGLSDLAGLVVGTQLTRCFTSGTCQSSSFAETRGSWSARNYWGCKLPVSESPR